jgi:hypothetical protein
MKVLLVAMPWQMVESPSLPIGILKACAARCRERHDVVDYYANIAWSDYLLEHGRISPDDYSYVANVGVWHAVGDWVFAGPLYGDVRWRTDRYLDYARRRELPVGSTLAMRELAFGFVDTALDHVIATGADVVAFSSTFSQNTASLALARRVKEHSPGVVTVLGGSNCDGPMGAALHRNFPFLDYVVSGEGEVAFVALLDALTGDRDVSGVPGLCWRDGSGRQRARREPHRRAGQTRARAGVLARLLVGREAPLHVLRPERAGDDVPVEAGGGVPRRTRLARHRAPPPRRRDGRQHPRPHLRARAVAEAA